MEEKLRATNHYAFYPSDEKNIPPYLAYGFRPVFLLLAPYMVISMLLWGLVWSGTITISFMGDMITWHIYEMLFGVLTAGAMAFLTTGLPELFPGMVPFVGRRLWYIMALWIAGRISFWLIDITGIYLTAILNLAMLGWIIWFAKDTLLDKLQRHASLGYTLVALFCIEVWFFASMLEFSTAEGMDILKFSIGFIVILILLALRRVNMEAVNELLEDKNIDAVYISRPPKTNLAIFTILLFSFIELFFPTNTILGWVAFAVGAAVLNLTTDYRLEDKFILNLSYVLYLASIPLLIAIGYILIGWDILNSNIDGINHFRHFITTGGIGISYLLIMMIISWIHTGRNLTANLNTHIMIISMVFATLSRGIIPFYQEHAMSLYIISTLFWIVAFLVYIKQFFHFLLTPRADGIKG